MPATDGSQFAVEEIEQFTRPVAGMPNEIRTLVLRGAAVAFRGVTKDGRVAWVQVDIALLDEVRGLEAEVRTLLAGALRDAKAAAAA